MTLLQTFSKFLTIVIKIQLPSQSSLYRKLDEAPTIVGEASATQTQKINDLCLEFKSFVATPKV